jgi:pantothenate synthetase
MPIFYGKAALDYLKSIKTQNSIGFVTMELHQGHLPNAQQSLAKSLPWLVFVNPTQFNNQVIKISRTLEADMKITD